MLDLFFNYNVTHPDIYMYINIIYIMYMHCMCVFTNATIKRKPFLNQKDLLWPSNADKAV